MENEIIPQETYIKVCDSPESDGGYVERVGDEVHDIPHVADVFPEPHVPELLDLAPDEAGHPGQDAALHQTRRGAPLGGAAPRPLPPFTSVRYCAKICKNNAIWRKYC